MKRLFLLVVLAFSLFSVGMASAQAPAPVLENLLIQVWPEYDQPSVLVIYDFNVAPEALPATLKLRIPSSGNIFAVAQQTSEGLMNFPYEPPVNEGEYDVLTLTLTDSSTYRVEYYAPLVRNGNVRSYTLNWPGDYAVKVMQLFVQKPVSAQNLSTDPALAELPGQDGFVYAQGNFTDLPVGEPFSVSLSYEKDNDTLSVSNQPASLTGELGTAQGSTFSLTSALPWLLGGMGALLIVGGLVWFWRSGREQVNRTSTRKRHAENKKSQGDDQVYCSQCGKRSEGNDRFCRACGARLRRD